MCIGMGWMAIGGMLLCVAMYDLRSRGYRQGK
jgi:hypothetical protein